DAGRGAADFGWGVVPQRLAAHGDAAAEQTGQDYAHGEGAAADAAALLLLRRRRSCRLAPRFRLVGTGLVGGGLPRVRLVRIGLVRLRLLSSPAGGLCRRVMRGGLFKVCGLLCIVSLPEVRCMTGGRSLLSRCGRTCLIRLLLPTFGAVRQTLGRLFALRGRRWVLLGVVIFLRLGGVVRIL